MIHSATPAGWLAVALGGLDELLVDHAHCEKKAAAQALSLLNAYPERERLVRRLSALAIEELRHFRAVCQRIRARGLTLARDPGDPYARRLQRLVRSSGEARLVDRLLVCGLIEARSHERLALLGDALPDPDLGELYRGLARAEAGHAGLFLDLAVDAGGRERVQARLEELARAEADIVAALPLAPRIH